VDETPVCVLGLGLIGGSVLRAAVAAGREAFGYNRSADGAEAARADGYVADTDLTSALSWAAERRALVVVAVPMPAVPELLGPVAELAPDCPLTDVISVKAPAREAVAAADLLDRYVGGHPMAGTAQSGWPAGDAALFTGAPWVVSVDDHVDAHVFAQVMHLALDCGAVVVPATSDEHDRAAAAISHLPHLLAETLAGTAPELVRAMCEANADQLIPALDQALETLRKARASLADSGSVAELVAAGHTARIGFDTFARPDLTAVTLGDPQWRERLAAAGRSGAVIRSALPGPGIR
jgi:prephenate dehydrogenase